VPSATTDTAEFGGSITWGPGNITDTGAFTTTDIFVDADNGNLHLTLGSPAIDAGDNSALPAGITTDLDGKPRIVNGTVDLGAYESQMLPPLLTVAKFASPDSAVAYRGIVTYTLVLGNTGGGDPAVL